MVIQRFVLVVAVLAAAAPLPAQTPVNSGGFKLRNDLAVNDATVSSAESDYVAVAEPNANGAPLLKVNGPGVIGDQYIVLFKRGTSLKAVTNLEKAVEAAGGTILSRYRTRTLGFAVNCLTPVLKMIRMDPNVEWVEPDQTINATSVTQTVPSRGVDRIDQRLLPLSNTFQYNETGRRVHVYVFDTGIQTTHHEFGNRASGAFTAIHDGKGTDDCRGHGTHVAATIGGTNYGVAKKVFLHAVRVIRCNNEGDVSGLIEGVDWLTRSRIRPAVANLSIIAGSRSDSLDKIIQESIASGITYVVAAGNHADDACNYSPAGVREAITVGATTITAEHPLDDTRFILSNYGDCVDLFALGTGILSAWNTDDTATAVASGSSMAAAHVTGVAALYLERHPRATPAEVWNAIHSHNNIFPDTPNWRGVLGGDGVNDEGGVHGEGKGFHNELLHWSPAP